MMSFFENNLYALPLLAFLAVVFFTPLAIRIAPHLKLVDAPDGPDGRKQHEGSVPLIGGLIIFPVFIVLSILAGFSWTTYWPLYSAIVLLLVTGAVDDKMHLHSMVKFFIQFCAAALIIFYGGAQIHSLGDLFSLGAFGLGLMSLPFSFAAVVLLINAVNLMDGLDGLAAGFCAIALSWMAYGFYSAGQMDAFLIVAVLIASIAGFLIYNMRHPFRDRAALFLGDAGSLSLGLCLAWFALHAGKGGPNAALTPISVAWILAIPIMDTCAQFYRRVRLGRHPFSPDRGHLHHHFVHAGMRDGRATGVILFMAFLTGAFGVVGVTLGIPLVIITVTWIVALLAHMAYSDVPERYINLISRFTKK